MICLVHKHVHFDTWIFINYLGFPTSKGSEVAMRKIRLNGTSSSQTANDSSHVQVCSLISTITILLRLKPTNTTTSTSQILHKHKGYLSLSCCRSAKEMPSILNRAATHICNITDMHLMLPEQPHR